jgi:hypothetical protein
MRRSQVIANAVFRLCCSTIVSQSCLSPASSSLFRGGLKFDKLHPRRRSDPSVDTTPCISFVRLGIPVLQCVYLPFPWPALGTYNELDPVNRLSEIARKGPIKVLRSGMYVGNRAGSRDSCRWINGIKFTRRPRPIQKQPLRVHYSKSSYHFFEEKIDDIALPTDPPPRVLMLFFWP